MHHRYTKLKSGVYDLLKCMDKQNNYLVMLGEFLKITLDPAPITVYYKQQQNVHGFRFKTRNLN